MNARLLFPLRVHFSEKPVKRKPNFGEFLFHALG